MRSFLPISAFGSRKTSPSTRIFSRFFSPKPFQPLDLREKRREFAVPNPLTVAFRVTAHPLPGDWDPPGNRLPYRLTLAEKSRMTPIPNPLTSFPAMAHRLSRSPSPNPPAGPHPGSRKASPDRPQSHARQGFAVALTFLTGIKGVYFYDSQARLPPRVLQDIHN